MTSPINYVDHTGHVRVEAATSRYDGSNGIYCGGGVTDREYSNGNDYKYSTTEQDAIDYMLTPLNRNGSNDW